MLNGIRNLTAISTMSRFPVSGYLFAVCLILLCLPGVLRAQDGVPWDELPSELQSILGPMQPRWNEMPPQRQERLRSGASRWLNLTPDQRNAAQQQFRNWMQRSPEEREMIRNRFDRFQQMPPDRKRAMRNRFEQFRSMPPERQRELRRRFEENRANRQAGQSARQRAGVTDRGGIRRSPTGPGPNRPGRPPNAR